MKLETFSALKGLNPMFKELLIRFLKEKNKIIKEFTGLDYIDERDTLEIEKELKWTEDICQKFLKNMSCCADSDCCPWCYNHKLLDVDCLPCSYGDRNGYCDEDNSTYNNILGKIFEKLGDWTAGILNIPGIKDLINRFSKEANEMTGEKING